MTARSLHFLLTFSLVIAILVTAFTMVFAIALPIVNEPLVTTWPVSIDAAQIETGLYTAPNTPWTIEQTQGVLSVETTALSLGLSRALNILLVWGMVIAIIWYLRQVVGDVQNERPFGQSSAQHLKKAGYLLIALSVWLSFEVFIRFYLFMPNALDVSDYKFTHIRLLTESDAGVSIYPDFQIGFLVAGLFILVIANAFKLALNYNAIVMRLSDGDSS